MSGAGRAAAEAIAVSALFEAVVAVRAMADARDADPARLSGLGAACEAIALGGASLAGRLGLPAALVLRRSAQELRDAACEAPGPARDVLARAVGLHQALDAAATALGATPDCFEDDEDWSAPGSPGLVDMAHLEPASRTGGTLARGLSGLVDGMGRRGNLARRDVDCLVAGSLVLRVACQTPRGAPGRACASVADLVAGCVLRICAAGSSMAEADPAGPLAGLGEALAASGRLAGEVLAEVEAEPGTARPAF